MYPYLFGGRRAAAIFRAVALCAAVVVTALLGVDVAMAGDVRGEVKFQPRKLGKPMVRNSGFIERIENPLRPIKSFDPRPYLIVVLEGEGIDDEAKKPPPGTVRYRLLGESFQSPLLAVVAGTRVELENLAPQEVVLDTPKEPDLVSKVLMKPKSRHEFKIGEPLKTVFITTPGSTHVAGHVVTFPHRYFATVDRRGKFEISDVPEGLWKAKLWYRDGWVEGVEATFEVKRRRGEVTLKVSPDKVKEKK